MSVNIKPLGDRIVILPVEVQERTPGGIYLPQSAQQQQQQGVVVAVGAGEFEDFADPHIFVAGSNFDEDAIKDFARALSDATRVTRCRPMTVKVGDSVLYSKYAGSKIEFAGVEYEVHRQESIIAILPPAETYGGGENAENAIPSAFAGAI